jgi:glycosyltransferase involved in cell wall biosynthesis/GT2 family glycosyltransferase
VPVILFVSYSGVLGGAERVLIDCLEGVARGREGDLGPREGDLGPREGDLGLGEGAVLACPEGPVAERARAGGVRVLTIPERPLELRIGLRDPGPAVAAVLAHARETRALARDLEPVLTVAWGMRSALACALGGVRPFAFSHHDFLPGRPIGAVVRAAAARAALVTACSQAVADDLDPGGRRLGGRVRVVHPGLDVSAFDADSGAAPGARAVVSDGPEVVVIGALAPWKRPDLALEIAAAVAPTLPGLRVRVIGGPLDRSGVALAERMRARAAQADLVDVVQLAGTLEDTRSAITRAACLLHCAPREPFGLVLLEAMAAGRPVVAPDAGGPREILDAACGVLYEPGNVAAGATALRSVLADPARAAAMGRAGRERVAACFDRSGTQRAFVAAVAPFVGSGARAGAGAGAPDGAASGARAGAAGTGLAVLTVTHNSARELPGLVRSVRRHLPGARVLVVDSASADGSAELARSLGADVITLTENVGFGRACNRGLEAVDEPATALLNPDVELIDDSLLALVAEAGRADRPPRLLAPLVLNVDGTRQQTAHPVPGSAADLIRALVPPVLVPGPALAPWRARRPRRVGWAVGAALVARTDVLRRLGPFDPAIFMYGEDLELGLRAAAAGIPTWFWPAGRVVHGGAHASEAAYGGEPFEVLARGRHDVVANRLGDARARRDDRAQALTFASRGALKRALRRPAERERAQLAAVRGLRR